MFQRGKFVFGVILIVLCGPTGMAFAQYTSPHYQVNETFFGAGGDLQDLSPNYQAKTAAGELGIDHAVSANYQTYSGFNTTDKILLEVAVSGGVFDLGALSLTQTKAITTTFTVRDYLSSGYVVKIGGDPPTNGNHALCPMGWDLTNCPQTTAIQGKEQFGINLAANNIALPNGPGAFGSNPVQVPDTTFGFGTAVADYGISNDFVFVPIESHPSEIVAQSSVSSGITQYTLSAIANISKTTPGGFYGTSLFVDAIPTF